MDVKRLSVAEIITIAVFVLGVGYFYFASDIREVIQQHPTTPVVRNQPSTILVSASTNNNSDVVSAMRIPDGWKAYKYNDDQMGVAFMYPQNWQLKEDIRGEYLRVVSVVGDGYIISIKNFGGELAQRKWEHPTYYIGGFAVPKTWEFFDGEKYIQIFSMAPIFDERRPKDTLIVHVQTPGKSKEMSDRILSSFIFLK